MWKWGAQDKLALRLLPFLSEEELERKKRKLEGADKLPRTCTSVSRIPESVVHERYNLIMRIMPLVAVYSFDVPRLDPLELNGKSQDEIEAYFRAKEIISFKYVNISETLSHAVILFRGIYLTSSERLHTHITNGATNLPGWTEWNANVENSSRISRGWSNHCFFHDGQFWSMSDLVPSWIRTQNSVKNTPMEMLYFIDHLIKK